VAWPLAARGQQAGALRRVGERRSNQLEWMQQGRGGMIALVRLIVISMFVGSCGMDSAAAEIQRLIAAGKERTYLLERPASSGPWPTIIMLHGGFITVERTAKESGLDELGPRHGYAVAFPQGLAGVWNSFSPGKYPPRYRQMMQAYGGIPDDVGFLGVLVADLVGRGIADRERIYLAGYSNGGFMTLRMTCVHGELFAAVGVLLGGMIEEIGADCHPKLPMPALLVNGTSDPIVHYAGGIIGTRGMINTTPLSIWPNDRLVAFLRQLNGCTAAPERSTLPGQQSQLIEIESSQPCAAAPVILYRVVNGGHNVPPALDVAQLLLDFFEQKVRR